MHIGIVNWSLFYGKGGIERCANILAGALLERGHSITLFFNQSIKRLEKPAFPVPPGVSVIGLEFYTGLLKLDKARQTLVNARLDALVVMMSWGEFVWFPVLLKGTGIPMILSEHSNPEFVISKWNAIERMACMELADHIHVLTSGFAATFPEEMQNRVSVLPNPADINRGPLSGSGKNKRKILLGVGRFEENPKQFSFLIRAFALIADSFPDWDLRLCGNGRSFEEYVTLTARLGLSQRVQFPGTVTDVPAEYAQAEVFCIPSKIEGFPIVCVEAQSFGLPIVGFAACSGVNEIVIAGENGLLVDDMSAEALAGALGKIMQDDSLRERMSLRSRELVGRYESEPIFDAWDELLSRVASTARPTRMERIENGLEASDAARELLGRAHPFDRRAYVAIHKNARMKGERSPFTDKEIARFIRQMQWSCIPGYCLSGKCLKSKVKQLFFAK